MNEQLRLDSKKYLDSLELYDLQDMSKVIVSRFQKNFDQIFARPDQCKNVALYEPMKGEVEVTLLKDDFAKMGAKLYFPNWKDQDDGMMTFGIEPKMLDLVIVPGLVFGLKGERVGRGQGYYDRYLPQCKKAVRVALTFDALVYLSVDQNPWDQKMDFIVTEKRFIRCKS